jgi:hypothetical protein
MKPYCANCGKALHLIRKAIPSKGIIVDLVEYHECSETPVPFDLSKLPDVQPFIPVDGKDKFVKSLNDLKPSPPADLRDVRKPSMTGTDDLRDRRFDQDNKAKTTAPLSVLDQIKSMSNSIPERPLNEPSDDSEMGG